MKTNQPSWKIVGNIGDANPLKMGRIVRVDTTGVYASELILIAPANKTKKGKEIYEVATIVCERCTMLNNDWKTISDNPFHADKPAWFADKLDEVAGSIGIQVDDLARKLVGSNPTERAWAYNDLASYFGIENFDEYPIETTAGKLRRRFRSAFRTKKA